MKAALVCLASLSLACTISAATQFLERVDVYQGGKEGYAFYRIPGLVITKKGTILAYCEARRSSSDWGAIDIMLRRSTDGGKTWERQEKVADIPGPKEKNPVVVARNLARPDEITYNNPVMIADRNGVIHFLFCLEYMRCFYQRSEDDGITWSKPREITSAFEGFRARYDWKVLATGPGHGIELKNARLLVPVWISPATGGGAHRPSVTSAIFSDDAGATWQSGEIAAPDTADWVFPNEAMAVQLADGRVMLNVRTESKAHRRLVTTSADGATHWSTPAFDEQLNEPVCMASILRLSEKPRKSRILFSNPDNLSRADGNMKIPRGDRKNLSIRLSYDEGKTWPVKKVFEPGFSAYSDLGAMPDGTILCLYEHGPNRSDTLTLARFNLEYLTDGKDSYERQP